MLSIVMRCTDGPGSFLVRPSDNSPGNYSLFFYVNKSVQRFRIERTADGRYAMGGRLFSSLEDVIQRYRGEQIVAGYTLGQPVLRSSASLHCSPISSLLHGGSADLTTAVSSGFGSLLSGTNGSGNSSSVLVSACGLSQRSTCGSFSRLSGCESSTGAGSACSVSGSGSAGSNSGSSARSCCSIDHEQIYATLRESREKSQAQRLQQKLSAHLMKKSQRSKKWKSFFFVLAPEEQTLCFYENERKVRPKGMIDLSFSYAYVVHESLFDKPNVIQLVEKALPCISSSHFVCFPSAETMVEWLHAIRPLCTPQASLGHRSNPKPNTLINSSSSSSSSSSVVVVSNAIGADPEQAAQFRTLHLTLLEARRLPVKLTPHPFCLISLNKHGVARTSVKCPPDPIYEEEFILEEIPADVSYFSITLYNKG
jgi:hypothetical protein